ncbi:sialate O-acetylesterase [uncultured Algibacter sp.]|uniref:sialate O-acetylesterase n=1 Tax=uncultured Algibacter sp. TaxID=298659 RepID=UPI0026039F21|nr:sialate O-acetylesterase [uncultured Algibacter sp.]
MRNRSVFSLVVLFLTATIQCIYAEIKLPAVVSSNMVLQRDTTVKLWGWADPNEAISITVSWSKDVLLLKADSGGNWLVETKTTNSKKAQNILIKGENSKIELKNILFGEVWLCSGQSNMQQPVKGYSGQPSYGSLMAIAKSANSNLRLFNVDRVPSKVPLMDIEKYSGWIEASPESVPDFSAVAYYYGKQLQEILDVPVGLIVTSWGGSTVQAWISDEVLSKYQEVNLEKVDLKKSPQRTPTVLFNAMISPLISYTIKGVLWYQGESNLKEPDYYKKLFPAMVKDWRNRWGIGDFPFYYVQIAPFNYGNKKAFQSTDNSAFIREAQLACLELISNSGIAITMDIGEDKSVHPPKKKEVAERLLFNALNQTYGYKTLDYASPIYESIEHKDSGLVLSFKNAENGLYTFDKLEGFEIAGADKVFYPAEAKITNRGNHVFVKSAKVVKPVAVRYAWRNWIVGTLFDANLLPASSFRTDNWSDATH